MCNTRPLYDEIDSVWAMGGASIYKACTIKPVSSNHIQQNKFWAFQTGGCLLLYESSAESSCRSFLHYFHTAKSNGPWLDSPPVHISLWP